MLFRVLIIIFIIRYQCEILFDLLIEHRIYYFILKLFSCFNYIINCSIQTVFDLIFQLTC